MKLTDAVGAYRALAQMMKEAWDFDFIYPLLQLWRELRTDYEFFCNEEIRLVTVYGKKNGEGKVEIAADGSFAFADATAAEAYRQAHEELGQRDIGEKQKITLAPPACIRGEWVAALAPYCDFKKKEGALKNHETA